VVGALNQVAPYDWAAFFHRHLDSTSPDTPSGGLENAGWKVEFTDKPSNLPGRRGAPSDVYSIGLQLDADGTVGDSVVGSPAFEAGVSPGMKVVGVDGRVYTHDLLEDAIAAAKDNTTPIMLLVVDDDYYRTATIQVHSGERYPHLVRDDTKPDYLGDLIKPRVGGQ